MNSVLIWSYVGYAIAAIFLLISISFGALIYISSKHEKNNPIALPSKKVATNTESDSNLFDNEDFTEKSAKSTGRRAAAPIMHEPARGASSKNFFDDEDDFSITKGGGK